MSVSAIYFDENYELNSYYEFRPVFEFVFGDRLHFRTHPGY